MTPQYKLRTLLILLAVLPPLVAVVAPPIYQWMTRKPLPVAIPAATIGPPYFQVYATGTADPQQAYIGLTTILAGTPNARMSLDRTTGSLAVLAPADVHKTVQTVLAQLQAGAAKPAQPRE